MSIKTLKGEEGIKLLFEKTLENKEKILRTILTGKPLVYLAGEEFAKEYMVHRNEGGIFLKSLRLRKGETSKTNQLKEIKYAEDLKIEYSLVIWDDSVAIVDSETLTCTILNNSENAKAIKEWFDFTWSQSK